MPRRALDYYETPPHYVQPLLALVGSLAERTVYEPCVGQGHIARYLTGARHLATNDLDPACPADAHDDARTNQAWQVWPEDKFDWTITNPPFSDELEILNWAVQCSHNVAFLARLSFLEPTLTRIQFWTAYPPTDVIVLPRYSFRQNDQGKRQTDSVTCCWVVYRDGREPCLRFSGVRE
jgi:hypothetical protein